VFRISYATSSFSLLAISISWIRLILEERRMRRQTSSHCGRGRNAIASECILTVKLYTTLGMVMKAISKFGSPTSLLVLNT
jgi:hypothetical protein